MAVDPSYISRPGPDYTAFRPAPLPVLGTDYLPAVGGGAGSASFGDLGGWAASGNGGATYPTADTDEGSGNDEVGPLPGKKSGEKEVKRRSSKACDNCRKCKCKCTRAPLADGTVPKTGPCQNCVATGADCTFSGASRKRGPPKGYIEAIESRLHRMEALLGGLLESTDPRAQALLSELIGDNEAKELLRKDLRMANERTSDGKVRKSWKLPPLPVPDPQTTSGGPLKASGSHPPEDAKPGPHQWRMREEAADGAGSGSDEDTDTFGGHDHDGRQVPQRRRLNSEATSGRSAGRTSLPGGRDPLLAPLARPSNTIPHTGAATYTLGNSSTPVSPGADASAQSMSEFADVVGQLSLDENAQVRYHGRSSGLYLISKSNRYRDFFWRFPKPGVWPPTRTRQLKTEAEIVKITGAASVLPNRETMEHLLELYWAFVHPVMPVVHKDQFVRRWQMVRESPDIASALTSSLEGDQARFNGGNSISMLLLLVIFSLAARYSDREGKPHHGEYWPAGDTYLTMAKAVLNQDYVSSKITTCQSLVLLAYREVGIGAMAESWLYVAMAIRMAQDMGMFRDADRWIMPVAKFDHAERQTRKRVWWACIILDKYLSTYVGRPMMIIERDFDTALPSLDEPDELEQWHAIRPDGSDLAYNPDRSPAATSPASASASAPPPGPSASPSSLAGSASEVGSPIDYDSPRPAYPPQPTHALSCFNASASLSVHMSRIIANIYAIRIRVIGQSSETLLSLMDSNLANWYLDLPDHLRFNPSSKRVPPPNILTLHAQFYTALILLHRPFIPNQQDNKQPSPFPSHSICTTAANAIATIAATYSRTFGLRQSSPFLVYYVFTAAILHVYNSTFDPGMAVTGKRNLLRCMNALKEMESTWGGAVRAWELLLGLVDFSDVDLTGADVASPASEDRGVKRPVDEPAVRPPPPRVPTTGDEDFQRLTNFHGQPPRSSNTRRSPVAQAHRRPPQAGGSRHRASVGRSDVNLPNFAVTSGIGSPPLTSNAGMPISTPPTDYAPIPGASAAAGGRSSKATSSEILGLANLPPPHPPTGPSSSDHRMAPASSDARDAQSFRDIVSSFLGQPGPEPPTVLLSSGGNPTSMAASAAATGSPPGYDPNSYPAFNFDFSSMMGMNVGNGIDSSSFFGMPTAPEAQSAADWAFLSSAFPVQAPSDPSLNADNLAHPRSAF